MKNFLLALTLSVSSAMATKLDSDTNAEAEQYDLASLMKADYTDYNPKPAIQSAGSSLLSELGLAS